MTIQRALAVSIGATRIRGDRTHPWIVTCTRCGITHNRRTGTMNPKTYTCRDCTPYTKEAA